MSYFNAKDPVCETQGCPQQISVALLPRAVDLGGFKVDRIIPSKEKKTVGPFVFWDQAGPEELLPGKGIDILPHPHIGLSTMTYLFSGKLEHRDTLGSHRIIIPGEVNIMTAGRGIAHSERTPQEARFYPHHFFGIQCWLALALHKEETNPSFTHYDKSAIPTYNDDKNMSLRVVTGEWMGLKSSVITPNDALFVECKLKPATQFSIPSTVEERAIHLLSGTITVENTQYNATRMLILKTGVEVKITATSDVHMIILGGATLEQRRYLWWNFVASSKERIEQAKLDWKEGRFGKIPGDDRESIPLPE
ncbi:pirin family protein [Legionella qingyii]|uniref:Pirin family protein n=2 Tax=Legionella qingyii TaxID=2184757 RepID=A0ABY0CIP5_9GAMM|nr:pirin family protein [Legionella qingyii]RUR23672.1 pirin family protein [Legionella qingyii]RUR26255.1 pirin family protein [Legionella qingyii]